MITGARNFIEIADPPVQRGGLLVGAQVIDVGNGEHSLIGFEYLSMACAAILDEVYGDPCSTDVGTIDCANGEWIGPVGATKEFGPSTYVWQSLDPFGLYAGVECDFQRLDESLDQAKRRFSLAERRAFDLKVMSLLNTSSADIGGPFPAAVALGRLEQAVMNSYGGTPLIAIPNHLIPLFCEKGILSPNLDGSFTTCNQSTAVAVMFGDGQNNQIFGLGRLIVVRGPLNTFTAPPQFIDCQLPGTPEQPGSPLALSQGSMLWTTTTSGPPGDGHVGSAGGGAVNGVHRWSNLAPGGGDWAAMLAALDPSNTNRQARYVNPGDATQWTEFNIGTPVNRGAYYDIPMTTTGNVGAGGGYVPSGDNSPLTVTMTAVSPVVPAIPGPFNTIEMPARALAERLYVVAAECGVYSIGVDPCDCVKTTTVGTQNPPPADLPELGYLSQASASASDPPFALHLHGEHLDDDTEVLVNGTAYPTAFIDDHEVEVTITPSSIPPGVYVLRLRSPAGLSVQTLTFTITP